MSGDLIQKVEDDVMANIEIGKTSIESDIIDTQRIVDSIREFVGAECVRSGVHALRPGVSDLSHQAMAEALLHVYLQSVVPTVSLPVSAGDAAEIGIRFYSGRTE